MPYFVRKEPQSETLDPEADPIATKAAAFAAARKLLESGAIAWVEDENGMMIEDDGGNGVSGG